MKPADCLTVLTYLTVEKLTIYKKLWQLAPMPPATENTTYHVPYYGHALHMLSFSHLHHSYDNS